MIVMSTEGVSLALLMLACPPSMAFVFMYGLFQPWFRSWWGWALFVSSTSLSAMLTMNLFYRMFGWPLLAREGWLRVGVGVFIVLGCWLTFVALLVALHRASEERARRSVDQR